jgi:hypothetical protein
VPIREPKYKPNQAILKDFGEGKFRVTMHAWLRTAGVEDEDETFRHCKGEVNDEKLESSLMHTRSRIFELAYCNPWEYFTTFTINKEKYDRYNLEEYHTGFRKWIREYNRYHGTSIKYLTIPEKHKDGAWHEHGFIYGIPKEHLREFTVKEKLPRYIKQKLKSGQKVYEWPAYREKFGFCDFEEIKKKEAVSRYVTKYISKNLASSITKVNAHLYYCSKGLQKAEEIKKGTMAATMEPDYGNEYVGVKWFSCEDPFTAKITQEYLKSNIL